MANHRTGNVVYVDTTNTDLPDIRNVKSVKYIGSSGSGSATIKAIGDRDPMWEHSGNVLEHDEVCLRAPQGIEVEVTNGAAVYIYVE